jgi:tetratricopeptide (TPR) repeat protein
LPLTPQKKQASMRQPPSGAAAEGEIHRAVALLKSGKERECLASLRRLNIRAENSPIICNLAALVCLSLGQYQLALKWFDRALALFPACGDAMAYRGLALHKLGRRAEALQAYDAAGRAGCAKPELFYNRGNVLRELGRLSEAIASYERALHFDPAYPEALRAGGLVLRELGRLENALAFINEAIRLRPDFTDALNDQGNVLQELDRSEEAIISYNAALERVPGRADILNNRGSAWLALGNCPNADKDFSGARRIKPDFPEAWSNYGNLLLKQQEPGAALEAFDQALQIRPSYAEALCGRAVALKYLRRFGEALDCFDAALAISPDSPHIKNNKGALLLLRGDFAQGLELYEHRWCGAGTAKDLAKLPVPIWNGDDLLGRRIVAFDEQGHGDAIQFARYMLLLARRGAIVTYVCPTQLHRLFRALEEPVRLADGVEDGDAFDLVEPAARVWDKDRHDPRPNALFARGRCVSSKMEQAVRAARAQNRHLLARQSQSEGRSFAVNPACLLCETRGRKRRASHQPPEAGGSHGQ